MHPQFREIISELLMFKKWHRECILEVVSNGYGAQVSDELDRLPSEVMVDGLSIKSGRIQNEFGPFNLAPIDDEIGRAHV